MSIDMNDLKRIAIVGRDADAWITALALQRLYGRDGVDVEIELIELPSLLKNQDVYASLPILRALHKMLGINESQLLKRAMGTYSMGQRFSNWSSNQRDGFFHAYDSHGATIGGIAFIHYWLKARARGLNVPLEDFSLGASAAKQGRFDSFSEGSSHFSAATHGYHCSAIEYVQAIAVLAVKEGLTHSTGQVHAITMNSGNISEVELTDGRRVVADLFIDASGDEAVLIREFENSSFENWQRWFPADTQLVAEAPALSPIPAFAQITAIESGWFGLYPLSKRTTIRALYSSEHGSCESVFASVAKQSGMAMQNMVISSFSSGMRRQSWCGNCVALGCSSAKLEPLDATDLAILHTGLVYLISLFPLDASFSETAVLFNKTMQSHIERLRDFTLAHYKLNRRSRQTFWDQCRNSPTPETLEYKMGLFAQHAQIPMYDEEIFKEENWISVLVGHGLIPQSYNPLVERVPEQDLISKFQEILKTIVDEVDELPSLQAHVEMMI